MSRFAGTATAILFVALCGAAEAARPVVSLSDGETRWFVAGVLKQGQTIRCVVGGHTFTTTFSKRSNTVGAVWVDTAGRGTIQISGRGDGAAQISCSRTPIKPRLPTLPYVIGQNGVALIRGVNHRSQLRRVFGPPRKRH